MASEVIKFGDFEGQDEKRILLEVTQSKDNIFHGVISGVFQKSSSKLTGQLQSIVNGFRVEKLTGDQVVHYIENVSSKIEGIIKKSELFRVKGIKLMMEDVRYRAFLYWVVKIIEKSGMSISPERFSDVPDALGREIFNILGDKAMTSLFIVLKSFGLLDYSKNIINTFEQENELKILEIDKEAICAQLERLGAVQVFNGDIQDLYYDYADRRFDADKKTEKSFRIRKRIDTSKGEKEADFFYTLKRKQKTVKGRTTRGAFEKEYKILGFDAFIKVIEQFGLQGYRAKQKERVSYAIDSEHIKFDIDQYDGIPCLIEIECDNEETVKKYIKLLGLGDNKVLRTGSRGLFKYYGKMDDYIFADNNKKVFQDFVKKFKKDI